MQTEQRGQCLIWLLCACAFLTAGPTLDVYGAQDRNRVWYEGAWPERRTQQLRHWNIGDTVTRNIGGKSTASAALTRTTRIIWIITKAARCFSAMR